MRNPAFNLIGATLVALFGIGCAGQGSRLLVADPPVGIRVQDRYPLDGDRGPAAAGPWSGPLSVAVPGEVHPERAPLPANDAERLVFAHLYENLTVIDSEGLVRPALAERWSDFGGGKVWDITLRTDARFWDGSPVTAASVASAWTALAFRLQQTPHAPTPLAFLPTGAPGLRILDDRSLRITLPQPVPDLPAVLAHPSLAVRGRKAEGWTWPLGSGPCRPGQEEEGPVLEPNPLHPSPPTWSSLRILPEGEAADLAVTRKRNVRDELSRDRRILTGPWNRMQVLICPPARMGSTAEDRLRWTTGWSARELVLRNPVAVSGEAWSWSFQAPEGRICPLDLVPVQSWDWPDFAWPERTTARDEDLILFPAEDPEAAYLAGSIAEWAARPLRPVDSSPAWDPLQPTRPPRGNLVPQALGLERSVFEAALQSGRAGAYILPLDDVWGSACRQLASVTARAVWLQEESRSPDYASSPLPQGARPADPTLDADVPFAEQSALRLQNGRVLLPLTVSRMVVGMRRELGGLVWRHDGLPDLTGLGRTSGSAGYQSP
ncbi:hypothetical protein KJ682_02540 [bacterium]|nr:hypothetical protein [bacterium]